MSLETIEHLVLHVVRDTGPAVSDREHDGIVQPLGGKGNGLAAGREAYRIGQQIEQRLAHASLVGNEAADIGSGANLELDATLDQAVLYAFGGGFHGLADVHRAEIERHGAGVDGGAEEEVL